MRDARAGAALHLLGGRTLEEALRPGLEAARRPVIWEADLAPMWPPIDGDPTARPAVLLLAAGDELLHVEMVAHAPSDAAGVARLIVAAVHAAVARGAALPALARVRHAEVASAVRAAASIQCEASPELPIVDEMAGKVRQHARGLDLPVVAMAVTDTWAAWRLPADTIRELFAAAASYHAARPWMSLTEEQPLRLTFPGGTRWLATVQGNAADEERGLILYADPQEFAAMHASLRTRDALLAARAPILSLTFGLRGELPRPMEREVVRAGWPVDGPQGYPMVSTLNTIGGGFSPGHAREAAMTLDAIPRFVAEHALVLGDARTAHDAIAWTDPVTGIRFQADARPAAPLPAWPFPAVLTPGLPRGPGANPRALYSADEAQSAALREQDDALLRRFTASERDGGAQAGQVAALMDDVDLFVAEMREHQGVSLAAVTEYDLRVFVYDLFPRCARTTLEDARAMRESLIRFTRYLGRTEGIEYPWAAAILGDETAFDARWTSCPGDERPDDDMDRWIAELYDDLSGRAMLPAYEMYGGGEWSEVMGPVEAELFQELQRQWLRWRDAVIRDGISAPEQVHAALRERQEEWERTARGGGAGRTPIDLVRRERSGARGRR